MNTTFRLAPWADVLYAMDRAWWTQYLAEAREAFMGRMVAPITGIAGVQHTRAVRRRNSGVGAIALAAHHGARIITLLGYDCQKTGGRAHWHGDHPKGLGNAGGIASWPAQFRELAHQVRGVKIVNASRETALDMFPRVPLSEALA